MTETQQTEETSNQNRSFSKFYDKNYKLFLILPAIILILSLSYLFYFYSQNNDIIKRDVSLIGGTTITINDASINLDELNQALSGNLEDFSIRTISDLRTGEQQAVVVQTISDDEKTKEVLENFLGYKLTDKNSSIEFTGSSLSQDFYKQLVYAIILAFTFMGAVVFFIFGKNLKIKILIIILSLISPLLFFTGVITINTAIISSILLLLAKIIFYIVNSTPSFAVVLSAFADIVMTVALVDLLGWKISSAGIVAFLMLIGYSVDTDIMLTSNLLRRKDESVNLRMYSAFKTGITMTLTSLAAVVVALIITSGFSEVLKQIFSVLTIGLCFDLLNTWVTNASILKWYVEKKEQR